MQAGTTSKPVVFVDVLFVAPSGNAQAHRVGERKANGHRWCHMWSDDLEALHRVAAAIGLKRAWFQDHRTPHYDLTPAKRALALKAGAVEKDLMQYFREKHAQSAAAQEFLEPERPAPEPHSGVTTIQHRRLPFAEWREK